MERGEHRVAGLHGTKCHRTFDTSDLPHHDLVRTLTERGLEEVEHGHVAAFTLPCSLPLGDFPGPVFMGYLEFRGILDGHDLVLRRNEGCKGVQAGGLAACSLAAHEERHAILDADPEVTSDHVIAGLELDQLQDADRVIHSLTNGEVAAFPADISAVDDVDTRSVRQGCVDDRVPVGDGSLGSLGELDHEIIKFLGIIPPDDRFEPLEYFMFNEDRANPVDRDILDVPVIDERF
ncbi:MAG: hypothetical protein A4E42_01223 [Methanoregulaceae archaeon PtaU1.Bin222]|nr:MAG: hypothetical protein A4E42_01223 [Methanoregulaceae archaeon PtaU1.Bin222]